jgi:filamentous hemagglutinin family protein
MTRLPHASPWSRHRRISLLSGLVLLQTLLAVSQAQITLDGSLGPPGPLAGPHSRIGAELGQIRGGNLFHSFGQFNVPTGGSATFAGPSTITNILSRVTGGQPSSIDGVLRSEIAGANLYLLNPSGVVFGPNARLDVRGSFHVSTADFLRMADGAQFFANLGQASVLTVAEPAAFGFLANTPAPIRIQGSQLRVPPGGALSVVGGDITMMGGSLQAPSGRMQLASVAAPGEVLFRSLEMPPDLQVDGVARLGRLTLSQRAVVNASGNGGGTVLVRSGRLLVDQATIAADNTGPLEGSGLGVDLRIAADAVITNGSRITTDSLGRGGARDLRLMAGSVHIDHAVMGSQEFGGGNVGDVTMIAPTIRIDEGGLITTAIFRALEAGDIVIKAGQLTLTGSSVHLWSHRDRRVRSEERTCKAAQNLELET